MLVGDSGVGKTTLVNKISTGDYLRQHNGKYVDEIYSFEIVFLLKSKNIIEKLEPRMFAGHFLKGMVLR